MSGKLQLVGLGFLFLSFFLSFALSLFLFLSLFFLFFLLFCFCFIAVALNCRHNHSAHGDPTVYLLKPCYSWFCLSFEDAQPQGQISAPHDIFSLFSLTHMCRISSSKSHSHNFLRSAGRGGSEGRKLHLSASVPPLN